jgi:hypothetical protein
VNRKLKDPCPSSLRISPVKEEAPGLSQLAPTKCSRYSGASSTRPLICASMMLAGAFQVQLLLKSAGNSVDQQASGGRGHRISMDHTFSRMLKKRKVASYRIRHRSV